MNDKELLLEEEIEVEEIEIEAFAKRNEKPPKAKRYIIRVDKEKLVIHTPTITGAQILAEVKKTSDRFKLYQHKRGHQPILIEPKDVVDLKEPGVERFTTMAKDTTEGRCDAALDLRHQFSLPVPDEEYLDGLGLPWETIKDNNVFWLLLHDWKLPSGYTVKKVSIALLIPSNYSDEQIDMVYFNPPLARTDGVTIKALSTQSICNEIWQRWSRHRTTQNPWRVGIDDVASHLSLVDEWLRREFEGVR